MPNSNQQEHYFGDQGRYPLRKFFPTLSPFKSVFDAQKVIQDLDKKIYGYQNLT